jgi:hypothetical protein
MDSSSAVNLSIQVLATCIAFTALFRPHCSINRLVTYPEHKPDLTVKRTRKPLIITFWLLLFIRCKKSGLWAILHANTFTMSELNQAQFVRFLSSLLTLANPSTHPGRWNQSNLVPIGANCSQLLIFNWFHQFGVVGVGAVWSGVIRFWWDGLFLVLVASQFFASILN